MVIQTDTTPYKGHRNWYLASLLVATLLLVWTAYVAHRHNLSGWNKDLFTDINNWPDRWHRYFKVVSIAKSSLWIGVAAVAITFLLRMWRLSFRLALSTVGGYAAALILKHFIAEPRPVGLLNHVNLRWSDSGTGFPSGHVMIMTIVMLTLVPYLSWKWRWIVPLGIGVVGISRIYLGLHSPIDVLGGFALGLVVVSAVRIMPQSLRVALHMD